MDLIHRVKPPETPHKGLRLFVTKQILREDLSCWCKFFTNEDYSLGIPALNSKYKLISNIFR